MFKSKRVNLRQRSPVVWGIASLIAPVFLYWLHSSRGQINFLNRKAGQSLRIMNPWWLTGCLLLLLTVIFWASFSLSSARLINSSKQTDFSVSDQDLIDRFNRLEREGLAGDQYFAGLPPEALVKDPGLRLSLILWLESKESELPQQAPTFVRVLVLAWLALYFSYLRQHMAGIKALDDDPADRTLLTMAIILAATLLPPLGSLIAYRSQAVLNWAIDRTGSSPEQNPAVVE